MIVLNAPLSMRTYRANRSLAVLIREILLFLALDYEVGFLIFGGLLELRPVSFGLRLYYDLSTPFLGS